MSLPEIAAALLRQKVTALAIALIAFAAVCAVTFSLPKEYEATATLAVGGNRPGQDANPVEFDQTLARTYRELLQTPSVRAVAVRSLPFDASLDDVAERVSFEAVGGTALIRITATDRDPSRAQLIANTYAESFVRGQRDAVSGAAREGLARSHRRLRELALRVKELRDRADPDVIRAPEDTQAVGDLEQARTELAAERDSYIARRQTLALQGSNLTVASAAGQPEAPARPRPKLYLALGLALSLVLGVFSAVLRDSFDSRLRYGEDVAELVEAPVLGRIPRARRWGDRRAELEDAFQLVRSNLELHDPQQRTETMGVTSSARGEGKTFVAAGLARALALVGARVTIVDCDLRRPALHRGLEVDGSRGLSDVLQEHLSPSALLQQTQQPNLRVLAAGRPPPNAAVLLTRESFSRVIDELRESADYVICDLPPVALGADAASASASVDGVIVVVDSSSARRSAVIAVRQQLENSGTRVLGLVLNRVRDNTRSYGRSRDASADDLDEGPADRPRDRPPFASTFD